MNSCAWIGEFWPVEVSRITDEYGALVIDLWDTGQRVVRVKSDSYFAYRKMDEGDALQSLLIERTKIKPRRWLYVAHSSAFLRWFHEESENVRQGQGIAHYALRTSNDFVDILAIEPPEIFYIDAAGQEQRLDIPWYVLAE